MTDDDEKGPGFIGGTTAAGAGVGTIAGVSSLVHKKTMDKHPKAQAFRDKFKNGGDTPTLVEQFSKKFEERYKEPNSKETPEDREIRKKNYINKEIYKVNEPIIEEVAHGGDAVKKAQLTEIKRKAKLDYEGRKPNPLQHYEDRLKNIEQRRKDGPGIYGEENRQHEWDALSPEEKTEKRAEHRLLDKERDQIIAQKNATEIEEAVIIREWKASKAAFIKDTLRKSEIGRDYIKAERFVNSAEAIGKGNKVSYPIAAFMGLSNGGRALTVGLGVAVAATTAILFKKMRNSGSHTEQLDHSSDSDISR